MKQHENSKYILSVDHGTSGVKTSIVSIYGKAVDVEFESTPVYFLDGGGSEQNPDHWWNALLNTCKKLVQKNSVPKEDIIAISVSSTFSSTVAVDKNGNHLMNCLTWMDSRGAPYVKKMVGGIIEIEGYGLSSVIKWLPKTGGAPTLSGKDDIAHVLYIKEKLPGIYEKTYKFLTSKDYLNCRLTGEFASSPDSMMLFWVVNTRNINNPHYDSSLIDQLGIEKDKLPVLLQASDILGTVKKSVADEIGINPDVKVIVSSPDHQCAGIGSGAVLDYQAHAYIGTSSWLECVVPFKKTDVFHSIASFAHAIPGKYFTACEQDIAGGCLSFMVENILYYDKHLNVNEPPDEIYKYFDEVVKNIKPGSEKLIFTPWLNGERTPVDSNTLRGGFYNLSVKTTAYHLIRAIFEGVAFNTRWMLMYVEKFIKRNLDTISIVGGGGKSDVWCQIFADIMDRQIRQVKNPLQANARGAAFIASVGLNYISYDDIPDLIEYTGTFSPNPDNRKLYDDLFREFVTIYKNNKKMFNRLNNNS